MGYTRNPTWVDGVTQANATTMENIEGGIVLANGPRGGPQQYVAGNYYGAWRGFGSLYDTFAITAGTLYATPLNVGETTSFDQIAVTLSTAGGAGSVARMGIYKSSRLVPTTLVADGGTVSAATTGMKAVTIAATLDPGLHWVVFVTDAVGAQARALAGGTSDMWLRAGQTVGDWHDGNLADNWRMTGYTASSPLPSTASLTGLVNGSGVGRDIINVNVRAA